jgi:hypothetical protein
LAKELLTTAELMTVLHRQGFETVEEVERCILQPGGTFDIKGINPPLEKLAHDEIMRAFKISAPNSMPWRRRAARPDVL